MQLKRFFLVFFLSVGFWPMQEACVYPSGPAVVVSIAPFHGLVAEVMRGVGVPKLLVKPGASPHQYSLKPSDIQKLYGAAVIFWGGPALETFLIKPLQNVSNSQQIFIVQFDKTPGLLLLPLRRNAAFEAHDHFCETHHGERKEDTSAFTQRDMHFWLDPYNAMILTESIVYHLSKSDPQHKSIYKKNGEMLKQRLHQLDLKIAAELKGIHSAPYVVFHDAYQYFEHRYKLSGVGAIMLHPEIPPSAQRLAAIRETVKNTRAQCVFLEPQFSPKLVQSMAQDLHIKVGQLDPIGKGSKEDPYGYFDLLENLVHSLKQCLQEN
jgi:zinc transport system substrate-binding protein